MTVKYRVHYYESECGWGSEAWTTDYETEKEAKDAYQECLDQHMGKNSAPSYYIRPTYIGAVQME